jgi:hypothetical protein
VDLLLAHFNKIFPDLLLFEHEKIQLRTSLESMNSGVGDHDEESRAYSNHFGALHLLRYLLLVLAVDTSSTSSNFEKPHSSSQKRKKSERLSSAAAIAVSTKTPEDQSEQTASRGEILAEEIYALVEKMLDLLATDALFPCFYS